VREPFRDDPVPCVGVEDVVSLEGSKFCAVTLAGISMAPCDLC
jgi:hypothetical protein